MMPRFTVALVVAIGLIASQAAAQVDAALLSRAFVSAGRSAPPASFAPTAQGRLRVMVETPPGAALPGLVPLTPTLSMLDGKPEELALFAELHPDARLHWAPPRRPLLDQAKAWLKGGVFTNLTGLDGRFVVVGIVDTGFDARHPDLRNADGTTRVAWVLDVSKQPTGKHPEVEAAYGCGSGPGPTCAVFDSTDLNELLAADSSLLPQDHFGHGTHVASLAAGNGLSSDPPRFVGMAPEATLIIVRVTRGNDGGIQDPDVLLATRFIFERADAMGLPAVVNLSLGSDFGGHDGTAPLERGLASFVGSDHPGRVLVVAAGNSAGVYTGLSANYPPPFGIHTEVHVPPHSEARIPVLTPPTGGSATRGTVFVWIAMRPGDDLDVGVEDADGDALIAPLGAGEGASETRGDLTATVLNQSHGKGSPIPDGTHGAVVVLDGAWDAGETFAVRLKGRGTARLWVQSEGDLAPGAGSPGALFPRATKAATIGIPATTDHVIAVGATINRAGWTDRQGNEIRIQSFGALKSPVGDSMAFFSGAGPTASGMIKPDVIAPGAFVVGAMSELVDPTKNGAQGLFAGSSTCGTIKNCLVVDDHHAVTSGTSMASPLVAGAVALLLQRDKTLTQLQLRDLLQASARRPSGEVPEVLQVGAGVVDLLSALAILDADETPLATVPDAANSWLVLADSLARPDPGWPLVGFLQLRDAGKLPVDGFEPAALSLSVSVGRVEEPLTRVAPGLWRFSVVAPGGSGGETLTVRAHFDGAVLDQRTVPIAVDRWIASDDVITRGGCSVGGRGSPGFGLLALFALLAWRRRRRAA